MESCIESLFAKQTVEHPKNRIFSFLMKFILTDIGDMSSFFSVSLQTLACDSDRVGDFLDSVVDTELLMLARESGRLGSFLAMGVNDNTIMIYFYILF